MSSRAPTPSDQSPLRDTAADWTPDEARLLRRLREAAGLNEAAFAKANAISLAQLRALEDRGEAPFYSEAIKAYLGRRLLMRLGHGGAGPVNSRAT